MYDFYKRHTFNTEFWTSFDEERSGVKNIIVDDTEDGQRKMRL